jgi:S-adenosylmethionine synthetase
MDPRRPQIIVVPLQQPTVSQGPVEIVERKGRGHPDTLCDAAAEALSVALCREYLARTGHVLHHNVDKAVLCGGAAHAGFGGGEVTQPVRLLHVGRATLDIGSTRIDVEALARAGGVRMFANALRYFDPASHLDVETLIRPTSTELAGLFASSSAVPLANDTSMGCGYAPLTDTEKLVLAVEQWLTATDTLRRHPWLGEDVKVLGIRNGASIELTVAAAFVAAHVSCLDDYVAAKRSLAEEILRHGRGLTEKLAKVTVNAADAPERGEVYLTVTGTSAEAGDDGQVGRGNRANGLITPFRPMTLEALAGKNPISHVGKLYNAWAHRFAGRLVDQEGIDEATCHLASRIGAPITEPQILCLAVRGAAAGDHERLRRRAREELQTLPEMWREIVDGYPLF